LNAVKGKGYSVTRHARTMEAEVHSTHS